LRSSMLPGHYSKENSISLHQVLTTYVASHFSLTVFNTLSLIIVSLLFLAYSGSRICILSSPNTLQNFFSPLYQDHIRKFKSHGLFSQQLQNTFTISKV
jgi:hypothetical protein